nr:hypothetical protein [Tanacetum cinerariifolium]
SSIAMKASASSKSKKSLASKGVRFCKDLETIGSSNGEETSVETSSVNPNTTCEYSSQVASLRSTLFND